MTRLSLEERTIGYLLALVPNDEPIYSEYSLQRISPFFDKPKKDADILRNLPGFDFNLVRHPEEELYRDLVARNPFLGSSENYHYYAQKLVQRAIKTRGNIQQALFDNIVDLVGNGKRYSVDLTLIAPYSLACGFVLFHLLAEQRNITDKVLPLMEKYVEAYAREVRRQYQASVKRGEQPRFTRKERELLSKRSYQRIVLAKVDLPAISPELEEKRDLARKGEKIARYFYRLPLARKPLNLTFCKDPSNLRYYPKDSYGLRGVIVMKLNLADQHILQVLTAVSVENLWKYLHKYNSRLL